MNRKSIKWLPVLAIFFLWFLFSHPYFIKSLVPFPSTYLVSFFPPWSASYGMPVKNNAMPDVITQIYPWKKLTVDSWKSGSIPLWNPYSFAGTVQAANYQSAVFSPLNLLYFVLPFVDAWSLVVLFQPILAGLGMYVFLRAISRSRSGSLIGAFGFMFCNFITTWMAYGTLGYAIGFLPWALWGVVEGFKQNSLVSRIVLSLSLVLSLVSGHFQISIYVIGTVLAFILYKSYGMKNWRVGLVLILYFVFGITLAAPQLLLTYDAYTASVRSSNFIKAEVIPWQYLITLFSPDFYGNPVTRNDWFGHYAEWGGFVGVIPLLLAWTTLWSGLKGLKKFFLGILLVSVCFSYPTPLVNFLVWLKLPVLSTSALSRIIVLLSFSIAALSAYGMDEVKECWIKHQYKKLLIRTGFFWVFVLVAWFVVVFLRPFTPQQLQVARRNLVFPTVILLLGTGGLAAGFVKKGHIVHTAMIVCLTILVLFDVFRFASKWMPFDPRNLVYPSVPSVAYLQKTIGINRIVGNVGGEMGNMFSIPLIDGYDALYQGRYGEFMNAVSQGFVSSGGRSVVQFDKYGVYKTQALQLLGVRYIYHRFSDDHASWTFPYWEYVSDSSMHQIYTDEQYEIFVYPDAYPRAFLASSYQIVHNDQQIIDTMFSSGTNLRETLILEEKPSNDPSVGSGSAEIRLYTPDKVSIQTQSTSPKLLFLSDVYDKGWHVTVDGYPSTMLRADYDFRAVFVPAGTHMVQFIYFPDSLRAGIILFILSITGIIGVSIWVHRYEHRHI
jgi:hypothetical protein